MDIAIKQEVIKYQQGDVLLTQVSNSFIHKDKYNHTKQYTTESDGKIVLALGEATGHHHRFEKSNLAPGVSVLGYSRQWSRMPSTIEIKNGSATLYHEEHNPLTIPKGVYEVTQIREMDHISGRTRTVVD